jgi:hypothetical protein
MVPTNAMYEDIDASIASIKNVASEQLFVSGRVGILWKQVGAQTNVVQVHEAALQQLQSAVATSTAFSCQACGPGGLGAVGVPTDDGSSMPKPTGGDGDGLMASTMLKIISGNGQCHCFHVTELQKKVEAIEKDLITLKSTPLRAGADPFVQFDPWTSHRPTGPGGADGGGHGGADAG